MSDNNNFEGLLAAKCPVCGGSGKVLVCREETWRAIPTSVPNVPKEKTCHGCDGKGWVKV